MAPAIHESAHAVVGHLLGMGTEYVSIRPDGSGESQPDPRNSTTLPFREGVEREIQIAHAGSIAEYRYCDAVGYPDDYGCHPREGERPDKKRAWDAAVRGCTGNFTEAQELVAALRSRVVEAVDRKWDVILRLASAVDRDGCVSGLALYEILDSDGPEIGQPLADVQDALDSEQK